MFVKKHHLADAENRVKQLEDKISWYERHYEKQQGYIEQLYDTVTHLTKQLGMALNTESLAKLQKNPLTEDNSQFILDLHALFGARSKKGQNLTCYFGKDLSELRKKFQDRDFKNSKNAQLTEGLTLGDLNRLLKEFMWRKPIAEGLNTIRKEKGLDEIQM